MLFKAAIALACMMLMATALAQNPADMISSKVNAQIDAAKQNLTQKAVERITEGNLTRENMQRDISITKENLRQTAAQKMNLSANVTSEELQNRAKEQLRQTASQRMNLSANVTSEELQNRAKEELKNQMNQKVQQPGFEIILALTAIIFIVSILRRRD